VSSVSKIVSRVVACLSDELRRPCYQGMSNPLAGHCYVACEAIYHSVPGLKPYYLKHEGSPHWFLRDTETGKVIDPTASQFKTEPPYEQGVCKGFLTKQPSKRAKIVLARMGRGGNILPSAQGGSHDEAANQSSCNRTSG
jgi:hypothetical protein